MKVLFVLLFLCVSTFSQTVKWDALFQELPEEGRAYQFSALVPDGTGGCAILLRIEEGGIPLRFEVAWVNRRGIVRVIELALNEGPLNLHRVTRNSLYLSSGQNVRKYRWKAKAVEFAGNQPIAPIGEEGFFAEFPVQRQDNLGFFAVLSDPQTGSITGVRRFGN